MAVDLRKYEVDYRVIDSYKAGLQAELLGNVVAGCAIISAETLDTAIALQNKPEMGDSLAIDIPPDMVVDPRAVVESLRRAA